MRKPSTSRGPIEIANQVYCRPGRARLDANVYFVGTGESWSLIDAGWAKDAAAIERDAQRLFGVATRPMAILLTHCHPDHSGGARSLADRWSCPVYLHAADRPLAMPDLGAIARCGGPLDRRLILPLLRALTPERRDALLARARLEGTRVLDPGDAVFGLPSWTCLHTPGHTRGHVAFFRPADRVLISGDALVNLALNSWTGLLLKKPALSAPPWFTTWNQARAEASIAALAALNPAVLASGHGPPLLGPDTAERVRAFAEQSPA